MDRLGYNMHLVLGTIHAIAIERNDLQHHNINVNRFTMDRVSFLSFIVADGHP